MKYMEDSSSLEVEAKRYLEEFLQDLDEVESLVLKLADESKKADTLLQISRIVHSLKGTAGSYGFDLLSSACHKIEDQFLSSEFVGADTLIDDLLGLKDTMAKICEAYGARDSKALENFKEQFGIIKNSDDSPALVLVVVSIHILSLVA